MPHSVRGKTEAERLPLRRDERAVRAVTLPQELPGSPKEMVQRWGNGRKTNGSVWRRAETQDSECILVRAPDEEICRFEPCFPTSESISNKGRK